MRLVYRLFLSASVLVLLAGAACRKAPTQAGEVVAVSAANIPIDPADPLWDSVPEYTAALLLQDVTDPRLLKASTQDVRVRVLTDGSAVGFLLKWLDSEKNDMPGPGLAVDGCAVQLPKVLAKEPPSPQMGEAGKPVEVTLWRADWQASAGGRGGSIRDLYPNAAVDHYPFQASPLGTGSAEQKEMTARYAPAGILGNMRNGPRDSAVEDMVAEGPGTLKPAAAGGSKGKGVRTEDGWSIVLKRRLPEGLMPGARTQVAFAVWQGSQGEAGSRKMRTGWIPLLRQSAQ